MRVRQEVMNYYRGCSTSGIDNVQVVHTGVPVMIGQWCSGAGKLTVALTFWHHKDPRKNFIRL